MVLLGKLLRTARSTGCHRHRAPLALFSTDGDGFQSSRVEIFDRDLKRKQRDRAAWLMGEEDTLVDTVAENLLDRLEDCKRTFPTALCLGGSLGAVRRLLRGRGGAQKILQPPGASFSSFHLWGEQMPDMFP